MSNQTLRVWLRTQLEIRSGTGVSPDISAIHVNRTGETPVPLFSKHALRCCHE